MTESMKFGPEWLRNLSETPVQPQVRYQLAEYRYGREEMLALFSPMLQPPDSLKTLVPKGVYIEKAQQPLTMTTLTDEETRIWNRGINSDMVPRTVGKGERGGLRGAGGRGRARGSFYGGRGGGNTVGYGEEEQRYGERPPRTFERSQSERSTWSDRNGGEQRGGGNRNEGNWRRTRGGGDDEDWRPPKWSGNNYGRTNWREDEWDMGQKNSHLPEWATEKNSEGGGTFDSSGAFRSEQIEDDDLNKDKHAFKKTENIEKPPDKEEPKEEVKEEEPVLPSMSVPPPSPPKQKKPEEIKRPFPSHLMNDITDDSIGHDCLAMELARLMEEEEENKAKMWHYLDPQGEMQGPFTCAEMAEWFETGYFTLNLLVRRECDIHFAPLGELISNWGYIPFLPENHPLNKESRQSKDQFLMSQYQQQQNRLMMLRQNRPMASKPPEWIENQQMMEQMFQQPPPQPQPQHMVNNNNLRALLAQMQQQQQQQSSGSYGQMSKPPPTGPPPRTTEEISRTVSDFLRGLQAKSEQAQPPSGIESILGSFHPQQQQQQTQNSTAIQNLLRKMQATHNTKMQVNSNASNSESIWNGVNWNQWSHLNRKGIKTEQQILEEQLRAEDERMRDELRKHEEVERKEEEEKHLNMALRKAEEMSRKQQEEEDIRRKQEASRRAEVERQRKNEEKRKKDEEKRKQDEEKKERERLREEERKKKEEEKRTDVMAKVQRSQWGPPVPSNTTILDIQKSEREHQQTLRGQQQQQQQQQQHQQQHDKTTAMQLKWTESQRQMSQPVQSLADIQAEQLEQLIKLGKEKQEKEKDKTPVQQPLGSWSQGLTWGSGIMPPVWQGVNTNQGSGFWEQISPPKNVPRPAQPIGPSPKDASKSKAKREETNVMQLFNNCHYDDFTQWCTSALSNMQSTVDIPTFVSFLREIESATEVQEYVQEYFGDEKDAKDFARQFVERRNRLSGHNTTPATSTIGPSKEDFQQVKSKSKKAKKNKMQKVDTRILGFSTTSAPDRINVGDREYPEDI